MTNSTSNSNTNSSSTTSAAIPETIVVNHRGIATLDRWMAALGWLLAIGAAIYAIYQYQETVRILDQQNEIAESHFSGDKSSPNKIAIITLAGVIQDGHGFIKRQIDIAKKDKSIKAIVLRVNSPGGTVSGSDYIYHHLIRLKQENEIPIVVSMGGIAASGGYYVSMAVGDQQDAIFAEPTTTTGSIGVIIPHWEFSDLMNQYGVTDDSIQSHPRKNMLSPSRKMPPEHRELLQDYVNQSFERFKRKILAGRPEFQKLNPDVTPATETEEGYLLPETKITLAADGDRDVATGEVFTAISALKYGLIDRIGFLEDAVDRAAEIAGLDADKVNVIRYSNPAPWIDLPYLTKSDNPGISGLSLSQLFELNSPKAYYLATTMPILMGSEER